MEIVKFTSTHNLIFSESDPSSDTVDAKFIICDFDPNKNDVGLNRGTIDSWKDTLKIKPLVGKVVTQRNGKKDFSSHNVRVVEREDENGKKYQAIEFDTSAFGSFYEVNIETIDEIEYIVATAKIWKRFSQAYEVIKSRVGSESGIKTSWEIQVLESHFETIGGKQVKIIDKGVFIGHALLGESVEPAYDSSGLLSVASQSTPEEYTELWEALANDVIVFSGEEDKDLCNETAALTTRDLHQKIREALNPKSYNSNPYYSVWEIYPVDGKILAYNIDRESEDDYLVISYTVSEDAVSIGEIIETKLSKLIAEREDVSNIIAEKNQIATELTEKVDALLSASKQIEQLQASIEELNTYKTKVEEIEQAENEAKMTQRQSELKKLAIESSFITEEEIQVSEEIKTMIEKLDETAIKTLIADRFMKSLSKPNQIDVAQSGNKNKNIKKNLNDDNSNDDKRSIMSSYLKNR